MIRALLIVLVAVPAVAAPFGSDRGRYAACASLARTNPARAIATAQAWRIEGGGIAARHCLALAQFEKETQPMRTQIQRMQDSLQSMIGEYQKAAAQLTPAQRTQREGVLGARQQDYQQRAQEMQQQAQSRQEELMAPIMEQVNKVIQDVRAEDGYAFIFDAGAQVPFIVSADKNLDITTRVIDRLKTLGVPKLPAPSVLAPAVAGTKPPATGPVSKPTGVSRPRP